jgi:hypothetical protein
MGFAENAESADGLYSLPRGFVAASGFVNEEPVGA